MKKISLLLFGLFALCFSSHASHITGGDLQYRYIGDSTGIANHYQLNLRVYLDCGPFNSTYVKPTADVTSSCYPTMTVNLVNKNGSGVSVPPPTYEDCVIAGSVKCLAIYEMVGYVVLPGACSDFLFRWYDCCRPTGIVNLAVQQQGFYFEAFLNNQLGNNTSPFFISEPARAFCIGNQFNWAQGVIEPNNDSLRYVLVTAKEDFPIGAPLAYAVAAGYSFTQPMLTNPPNSFVLNQQTGTMSFNPSTAGTIAIALEVQEYRFDSLYFQWIKVGTSNRELIASVSPTGCSPIAQQGVLLNYNAPGIYVDPASGLPTVDYTCLDSAVVLKFATKLDCSSISPDGTDFRLTAPNGQPIPVKSLIATCDLNNESLELIVKLHEPLAFNGNYYLYSKMGNDGTTLLNKCGFPMAEFDTIQLHVAGCFTTDIDMRNVTVVDDEYPRVQWYLDTVGANAPFPKYLVDEYKVLRSDDHGANYKLIYTIKDYKNMTFNDKSLGTQDVDADYYKYKVDVVVNGFTVNATRNIHSILLETKDGSPIWEPADTVDLKWNAYNGWPSPEYTVFLGTKDGSGNWVETIHGPVGSIANPGFDTTYRMINSPGLKPGDYRVCVRADYPGGSGPYTAWSNCIPFNISQPTIPPVVVDTPVAIVIPNIITPNNDGTNDLFEIANIQTWNTTRSVQIFNRWGSPVFETGAYENSQAWSGKDMSGKNLADGVYMYVIEVYDQPSGKKQNFNGHVTIMGSTN